MKMENSEHNGEMTNSVKWLIEANKLEGDYQENQQQFVNNQIPYLTTVIIQLASVDLHTTILCGNFGV